MKVESAVALGHFLEHDTAINIIKPALEQILMIFFKTLDEIDYDELVHSLTIFVQTYHEEIPKYSINIC